MAAVEQWAVDRGTPVIVLYTRIDRDDAVAFYERIGYERAATSHLMRKAVACA